MIEQLRMNLQKTLHQQNIQCGKAPKSTLSNYFCTKQALEGTFWKIRLIQIQIKPQTPIEPNYAVFYLKSQVRVHKLVLLVQLSLRVASPNNIHIKDFYPQGNFELGIAN